MSGRKSGAYLIYPHRRTGPQRATAIVKASRMHETRFVPEKLFVPSYGTPLLTPRTTIRLMPFNPNSVAKHDDESSFGSWPEPGTLPNVTMRAALYMDSRALRLANQADARRSAACLPRGCDFGTEGRATESGALQRRAGRPHMEAPRPPAGWSDDSVPAAYVAEPQSPVGWSDDGVPAAYLQPAGHSAPVVVDVPAAYLQPAGRSAPAVDDARPASDDIVIIVRGGRRRAAKSSEQHSLCRARRREVR